MQCASQEPEWPVSGEAVTACSLGLHCTGPRNRLYPNHDGVEGIMGAEVADGDVECKKAVRRQVGAGADWIKVGETILA